MSSGRSKACDPVGAKKSKRTRQGLIAFSLIILSAVFALLSPSAESDRSASVPPAGNGSDRARVLFVPDGDTVLCSWQGEEEWVRLLRFDTPERDEPGYGGARDELRRLVDGKMVRLEFEKPGQPERDVHDRLLAYVFSGDMNVNVEMVRLGWSPFWTRYGEGRYADEFRRAEREARAARRGLWKR
jgi:micrococcal nuclease